VWKKPMGNLLKNKVVGMLGFGQVARRTAELMQPFRVKIIATDVNWDEAEAQRLNATRVSLEELLTNSEIVSLHLPLMDETRNIIVSR